jgi:hypothetical protein
MALMWELTDCFAVPECIRCSDGDLAIGLVDAEEFHRRGEQITRLSTDGCSVGMGRNPSGAEVESRYLKHAYPGPTQAGIRGEGFRFRGGDGVADDDQIELTGPVLGDRERSAV